MTIMRMTSRKPWQPFSSTPFGHAVLPLRLPSPLGYTDNFGNLLPRVLGDATAHVVSTFRLPTLTAVRTLLGGPDSGRGIDRAAAAVRAPDVGDLPLALHVQRFPQGSAALATQSFPIG